MIYQEDVFDEMDFDQAALELRNVRGRNGLDTPAPTLRAALQWKYHHI
jgi:hypothetical protein